MTGPGGVTARLKQLRRLSRGRRARVEADAYVIDGPALVAQALDAGVEVLEAFVEPGGGDVAARCREAGVAVHELAPGRLTGMTDTRTPQPVAAIARRHLCRDLDSVLSGRPVLVLVDVGDPGNVGTLVRVAEASGAAAVVCTGETVDPFHPKCVRASAGSLFVVPVIEEVSPVEVLGELSARGHRCLATSASGRLPYDEVDFAAPTALVLGSEAHGLPPELVEALDDEIVIPMEGRAESLNVAMAGAVVCFEALRQRRAAP